MDDNINLTAAEWQVMECLWDFSPATGREICEDMEEEMGWNRSTTLTLLRRLEAKGAVKCGNEGGKKTFLPAIRREDAYYKETRSLLSRAYEGSVSMMLSAFTKKQSLPQEEIDELYELLRELEEKSDA